MAIDELDVAKLAESIDEITKANSTCCASLTQLVMSGKYDADAMTTISQASFILAGCTASLRVLLSAIIEMNDALSKTERELEFRRSLDDLDGE